MKKFVILLLTASFLFNPNFAEAAHGCNGCNVRDEGVLNDSLIGATIYYQGRRGVAKDYNYANNTVYIVLDDGSYGWASASDVYTSASQDERNTTTAVVGTAAFVGVLCLLFCPSNNNSNSDSASDSRSDRQRNNDYYNRQSNSGGDSGYSSSSSSSSRTPQTGGLYGNCHGGTAYGCDN